MGLALDLPRRHRAKLARKTWQNVDASQEERIRVLVTVHADQYLCGGTPTGIAREIWQTGHKEDAMADSSA